MKKLGHILGYCLLPFLTLQAEVEDHLKKIDPKTKSNNHSMRNIDFIYVINLDKRPEKFEHCLKELSPYGIIPYRFSAIYGADLSFEIIHDVGIKFAPGMNGDIRATSYFPENKGEPTHYEKMENYGQTYFSHCLGRAPIAIVLSHLSVLQDAWDSGYETIWVMEDDIQVVKNPNLLSELIEKLDNLIGKDRWDILFTDPDTKGKNGNYIPCMGFSPRPNFVPSNPKIFSFRRNINKDFRRIAARYGAYSMIVRRSGMKKILDFIKQYHIFLPYDMDNYLAPGLRIYSVREDYVSTLPNALSDNH